MTDAAGLMILVERALRLRTVFHHLQPVPLGNRHQRIEVDALAVQMHRDDRFRARRNRRLDLADIHQEVIVADVDEYRRGTKRANGRDRRHRRIGHGNDLVAGLDAQRRQRDVDGVSSAVHADAARNPEIAGHFTLELDAFLPKHQPSRAKHAIDRGEYLIAQFVVFP